MLNLTSVRRKQSGMTVGTILLGVLVITLLGFTLAAVGTMHLNLSNRNNNAISASNLARSAVSLGIARVLEHPDFGKDRGPEATIEVTTDRGLAHLTFDENRAHELGLAYSTNNLGEDTTAVGGSGDAVPPGSVHLVSIGECGGVSRTVEAVLRVPPYPWAVASGGKVETRNGVLIGAIPPDFDTTGRLPTRDELRPADLLANSKETDAVQLGEDSTVLGDVETPGQVSFLGSRQKSVVEGEIRMGVRPVDLPEVSAKDFDPQLKGQEFYSLGDSSSNSLSLTGVNRRDGDLAVNGELNLDSALLYVDGNLSVSGGVKGSGVLVVTGDADIQCGLTVDAATEMAVLAGGKVALKGSGPASSTVKGAFYAGKGLEVDEMTLMGSLLTGRAASGVGLDHVTVMATEPKPVAVLQTFDCYFGSYVPGSTKKRDFTREFGSLSSLLPGKQPAVSVKVTQLPDGRARFDLSTSLGSTSTFEVKLSDAKRDDPDHNGYLIESELDKVLQSPSFGLPPEVPKPSPTGHPLDPADSPLNDAWKQFVVPQTPRSISNSLTIYDISQFIPLEDRIRVVTWYEH